MITPSQFLRDTEERRQALLAEAARAHLILAATRSASSAAPRPAGRAGLRHAVAALVLVASLVALAFVG